MKKIKSAILRTLGLILFITIIKPAFISVKSMEIIENPQVGDFYLVNRKKLEATEFAQDKKPIKRASSAEFVGSSLKISPRT
nr:hypothetical protein [uncultured Desulfobulbus sp.]